jgi:hypothetical protein
MEQLIPNDPAASDTVTEGTVCWLPRDAYAIVLGNKPEYSGRVRGVEKMLGLSRGQHKHTIPPHKDDLSVLGTPPNPLKKKSIKLAL